MKKRRVVMAIVVLVVAAACFIPLRFLSTGDDAKVFCNSNECYLFVNETHTGVRTTPLREIISLLKAIVFMPTRPSDQKFDTIVFVVSKAGIEKHVYARTLSPWGVYRNTVYGGGKQGAWKWTGRGFEVISDAECQEYDLAGHNGEHLIWGEKDGWTAQAVNPICDLKIPVKDAVLEIHRNVESSKGLMTIKFAGLPEVTWETPSRPVLVGRESYDAMFR